MSTNTHRADRRTDRLMDRHRTRRRPGVRGAREVRGARGGMRGVNGVRGARGSGVAAMALASGLVLSACSGGEEPVASPSSVASSVTSSSSLSSSSPTPTPAPVDEPASAVAAPVALGVTAAAAPTTTELPALVVDSGGPCHAIGEVAQALDGSPLFCLNDPTAGPLWLPQPEAEPDATEPALRDEPCTQEGLVVTAPDGTTLTCSVTEASADYPDGLVWR